MVLEHARQPCISVEIIYRHPLVAGHIAERWFGMGVTNANPPRCSSHCACWAGSLENDEKKRLNRALTIQMGTSAHPGIAEGDSNESVIIPQGLEALDL